jgi:DNA-binding FrmR family transcriptional regulator
MIRNDQQLTVVREQLQRVEAALDSLRRDVLPQNAD